MRYPHVVQVEGWGGGLCEGYLSLAAVAKEFGILRDLYHLPYWIRVSFVPSKELCIIRTASHLQIQSPSSSQGMWLYVQAPHYKAASIP